MFYTSLLVTGNKSVQVVNGSVPGEGWREGLLITQIDHLDVKIDRVY